MHYPILFYTVKILYSGIISLLTLPGYAQNLNDIDINDQTGYIKWGFADFANTNISNVVAYTFTISKSGRPKKDSILLFSTAFNRDSNIISGIKPFYLIVTHGKSHLEWEKFSDTYDKNGVILKEVLEPLYIRKEKNSAAIDYHINKLETIYEYDDKKKLIRLIYKDIDHYHSISKYTRDTFQLKSFHQKIYDYKYNSKGLQVKSYYTDDSTRYMPVDGNDKISYSAECFSCGRRYLNSESEYFENGKLKMLIWYTREGKVHSKKYYYYDSSLRLSKEVDSAGWYFETLPPYLESVSIYQYADSGKVVTTSYNTEARFGNLYSKSVKAYNNKDILLSECLYMDSVSVCTNNSYRVESGRILSTVSIDGNNGRSETFYAYNQQGLCSEMKKTYNSRMISFTRYYYK